MAQQAIPLEKLKSAVERLRFMGMEADAILMEQLVLNVEKDNFTHIMRKWMSPEELRAYDDAATELDRVP
jgi:hypothetical protein